MKNGKTIFLFMLAFFIIGYFVISTYNEINFQSIATDSGFDVGGGGGSSGGGGGSSGGSSYSSSDGSSGSYDPVGGLCNLLALVSLCITMCFIAHCLIQLQNKYSLDDGIIILIALVFIIISVCAFYLSSVLYAPFSIFLFTSIGVISGICIYVFDVNNIKTTYLNIRRREHLIRKARKYSLSLTNEEKELLKDGYQIYLDVQQAWMNFDYDRMRALVTDEMFHMYQNQLKTLEIKGQQNVMSNFKLIKYSLLSIKKEGNITTIEMILKVSFYDYIINKSKSIVSGSKNRKVIMTYLLTFVSNDSAADRCPHCGAKIENGSTVCDYCKTNIQMTSNKMKLAKKEALKQE